MKKNFKSYALIWAIMLAAFNAVVFLVRPVIPGYAVNYDARFWIAWGFILAAFIGNLVCAYFAFKAQNLKKLLYNLPLITVSYAGLIVMAVLGGALMLIPGCPAWIAAVVCLIAAAVTAAAVVRADWAGKAAGAVEEKVKAQTQLVKLLTVNAETLLAKAKTPDEKAAAKKVYEALRYSDPMSSEALSAIEAELTEKFKAFENAVNAGQGVAEAAQSLLETLAERNGKCKAMKCGDVFLENYSIFISHSSQDKGNFVDGLVKEIQSLGISVFYDTDVIGWGDNLKEKIDSGLKYCKLAVIVISPSYFDREWTEYEIQKLLDRQDSEGGKLIMPILYKVKKEEFVKHYPSLQNIVFKYAKSQSRHKLAMELKNELDKKAS